MAVTGAQAPMVITHEGGVKFAAQIRQHRVLVDQSPRGGGEDTAPMPIELLGAALGTCVAFYVQQYLHTRGLPYEGMRVEVEQRGAQNPSRIGKFTVRVICPAELPAHHMEMLERVARSCPAHGTLAHGADVEVWLEAPAGASV